MGLGVPGMFAEADAPSGAFDVVLGDADRDDSQMPPLLAPGDMAASHATERTARARRYRVRV